MTVLHGTFDTPVSTKRKATHLVLYCGTMEMRPLLNVNSSDYDERNQEMDTINANLADVAADIACVIEQVESLREDLLARDSR